MLISWVIIGQHWSDTIDELTRSLNKQIFDPNLVELIIVDDASSDYSHEQFNSINFKHKKIIHLPNHSGRTKAQNTGIEVSSGEFILFTQSNTIPDEQFLNKYIKFLSKSNIDGAAGIINYTCDEYPFEKYLNNPQRGLKSFSSNSILPIEYILFGNCALKLSLVKQANGFNEKLLGYGGEEIELLYRMNQIKTLQIFKIDSSVLRIGHPGFEKHLLRLIEFGETNFLLLPYEIQKTIIPSFILIFKNIIPVSITYYFLSKINKALSLKSFLLIRILMGLSILKGLKRL